MNSAIDFEVNQLPLSSIPSLELRCIDRGSSRDVYASLARASSQRIAAPPSPTPSRQKNVIRLFTNAEVATLLTHAPQMRVVPESFLGAGSCRAFVCSASAACSAAALKVADAVSASALTTNPLKRAYEAAGSHTSDTCCYAVIEETVGGTINGENGYVIRIVNPCDCFKQRASPLVTLGPQSYSVRGPNMTLARLIIRNTRLQVDFELMSTIGHAYNYLSAGTFKPITVGNVKHSLSTLGKVSNSFAERVLGTHKMDLPDMLDLLIKPRISCHEVPLTEQTSWEQVCHASTAPATAPAPAAPLDLPKTLPLRPVRAPVDAKGNVKPRARAAQKTMNVSEFTTLMEAVVVNSGAEPWDGFEEDCAVLFAEIDTTNSGTITENEWRAISMPHLVDRTVLPPAPWCPADKRSFDDSVFLRCGARPPPPSGHPHMPSTLSVRDLVLPAMLAVQEKQAQLEATEKVGIDFYGISGSGGGRQGAGLSMKR